MARCLAAVPPPDRHRGLSLGGSAPPGSLWVRILTATTGLTAQARRSGEAASAGAALLTAGALGEPWTLEQLNPVAEVVAPDPEAVAAYRARAGRDEHLAAQLLALGPLETAPGPTTAPGDR